jgi:hypothetical protein
MNIINRCHNDSGADAEKREEQKSCILFSYVSEVFGYLYMLQ